MVESTASSSADAAEQPAKSRHHRISGSPLPPQGRRWGSSPHGGTAGQHEVRLAADMLACPLAGVPPGVGAGLLPRKRRVRVLSCQPRSASMTARPRAATSENPVRLRGAAPCHRWTTGSPPLFQSGLDGVRVPTMALIEVQLAGQAQLVVRPLCKREAAGSSPASGSDRSWV